MTPTSVLARPRARLKVAPRVLGVACRCGDVDAAADAVVARARAGGAGGYACFCNVHVLVLSQHDPALRAALASAWAVFPDGAPVAWLQRRLGASGATRIAGPDLMPLVVGRGRSAGLRHFLLGSTPDVGARCADALLQAYPQALIVGVESPPFDPEPRADPALLAAVRAARADLVWVGLGAPKQELWMHRHAPALSPAVALGVGAAFEFLAGTRPRAPTWMRQAGVEWLHRLALEPRRLTGRYVRTNAEFVVRAGLELSRHRAGVRRPAAD